MGSIDAIPYLEQRVSCRRAQLLPPAAAACRAHIVKGKMDVVNLNEKLAQFDDHWAPRVIGELNGQLVKIAKVQGEFVWHHHEAEDELFYVVKGELQLLFRDREVTLRPGEFCIVPRGVEHKPVAKEEVHLMLFEPASTLNTGNVQSDLTHDNLERI